MHFSTIRNDKYCHSIMAVVVLCLLFGDSEEKNLKNQKNYCHHCTSIFVKGTK